MSLITWALNKNHAHKHIEQMRAEHLKWALEASKNFGTTWWTVAPTVPVAGNPNVEYDIHGQYVFNRWNPFQRTHLIGPNAADSWQIWWHYGPLTNVPQQTTESWTAARMAGHTAEMARAQKAVQAAIDQAWNLYPASAKALVNA